MVFASALLTLTGVAIAMELTTNRNNSINIFFIILPL